MASEFLTLQRAILQVLAAGQPVSARQAAAAAGLPLARVEQWFGQLEACGAEIDDAGNLTGLLLSLNPTPHRVQINGQTLYAWCALDALWLPALMEQPIQINSICAATGEPIQLAVSPTGVAAANPATTMLSVVAADSSMTCQGCQGWGMGREACRQMNFFHSHEVAAEWLDATPAAVLLTPDEAWQLITFCLSSLLNDKSSIINPQ